MVGFGGNLWPRRKDGGVSKWVGGKLGVKERIMKTGGETPEEDVRKGAGWSKSRDEGKRTFGRPLYLHLG